MLEMRKYDTSTDVADHMAAGDYKREWAVLQGREQAYLAENATDDVNEATVLPYAVWQSGKDARGKWDECPLVDVGEVQPGTDRAALMEHVVGMLGVMEKRMEAARSAAEGEE